MCNCSKNRKERGDCKCKSTPVKCKFGDNKCGCDKGCDTDSCGSSGCGTSCGTCNVNNRLPCGWQDCCNASNCYGWNTCGWNNPYDRVYAYGGACGYNACGYNAYPYVYNACAPNACGYRYY